MDIHWIKSLLKTQVDRNKYDSGFAMYQREAVFNDYAKIEGNVATFYATVIDEYHRQNYTCMAHIDLFRRRIWETSCDCQSTLQNKSLGPQLCPHIIATVLQGIEALQRGNVEDAYTEGVMLSPRVSVSMLPSRSGSMRMNFEIEGIDKKEYRKIYNAFKENKKAYRLPDGNYLDLTEEHLLKTLKLIDLLGVYNEMEDIKISPHKAFYLDQLLEEELDFIDGKKYITNVVNKFKKDHTLSYKVPQSLESVLRDYQIKGFEFLTTLAGYELGGILADDMGLGKTLQVITFLLVNKGNKSIVITPTALIYNWKNELDRFAPELKVAVVHGERLKRKEKIENIDAYDVILTTYTTYKNDEQLYKTINFDYCIIDEAQNIKNPDALITKSIKLIQAKAKFALTGTPIENNLMELWSIFDFVMPGYLYSRLRFQNIFINDSKHIGELKSLIQPFLLRRTKKEVIAELPNKIEQRLVIDLEDIHKRAYVGYKKLIKQRMKEAGQNQITLFSYLTKLRQLCLAPELLVKNYEGRNTKIDVLLELIQGAEGQKVLVFSQFTTVLKIIGEKLNEIGESYSYIDGKTSATQRVRLVDEFNASEENRIFLISLKAGGTGLNLTSASMVIHFDPWWNPSAQNQASDRAHRMGQKNVVNVVSLIAKNTVEERVVHLQESKKALIEEVIEGNLNDSQFLKNLSKDELISLFID